MKLLTILVNNRIDHIVDFEPRKESPNSYIVENTGGDINLFMFYRESEKSYVTDLICQTEYGKKRAKLAGIKAEGLEKEVNIDGKYHTYDVKLKLYLELDDNDDNKDIDKRPSDNSSNTNVDIGDFYNKLDKQVWESRNLKVKLCAKKDSIYRVRVDFIIRDSSGIIINKENAMLINVVPKDLIWDVVLDYGSESSQMLVFNRGKNDKVTVRNIVPLFQLFQSSLGEEGIAPSEYLQFDADDCDNLFRSFFFARKDPDCNNLNPCIIKDNNNLKFMTHVAELEEIRQSYLSIPNIKVASHGGVRLPSVTNNHGISRDIFDFADNYFYRTLVNSFLYQAMRYLYSADRPSYLNICLLMPNVYTQSRVTENLVNIAHDVLSMANDNQEINNVSGVEVAAVSESDASFLGFMSQQSNGVKKGRYLILDAGKGTLDFSILEYNPDPEVGARHMYNSIVRSGIIGAGNAITYSVLLAVLKDVLKKMNRNLSEDLIKKEISDFIKNKITVSNADEASLCAMLDYLEEYKRYYNDEILNDTQFPVDLNNINSLNDLELVALNNILVNFNEKKYKIEDDSYIENMINELASDVAKKLKKSYNTLSSKPIDFVVFAGRGFKMKKLRESVCKALEQEKIEPVTLEIKNENSESIYKSICLYARGPLSTGRYNGRIVGKPQLIPYDNKPNATENNNKDTNTAFKKNDGKSKVKEGLKKMKKAIIEHIPGSTPSETINYLNDSNVDELNRELVNGFPFEITSYADEIAISGVSYKIPSNIKAGMRTEIFFTGSEFVFRQDGELGYLEAPTNLECQHVFESSFPFAQFYGGKRILIPFPKCEQVFSSDDDRDNKTLNDYGKEDNAIVSKYEVKK